MSDNSTAITASDAELVYLSSISLYITVAALGLIIWDILDNISSEFQVLFKSPITLSTVAYLGSRVGTLGYLISSTIFETAPTGHCAAFEKITDAWYPISLGFSALLFFLRVRAIYNRNRIVVAFFFVLWLGLVACTMFIPIGVSGDNVPGTNMCEDADVPISAYAAIIAPLVHDTLVFMAISWRLVQNAHVQMNVKEGFKVAVFGEYLPKFTKGLLLDGQRYYLVTLVSSLVTVIMAFDTSVPVPLRSMCANLNIVLVCIMACRVYRRTKSGLFRETEISTTNISAASKIRTPVGISVHTNRTRTMDDPYKVDIELASRKNMGTNGSDSEVRTKTLIASVGHNSDIDIEAKAGTLTDNKDYSRSLGDSE
ncbi:hypothetical protein BDN70DRAFT_840892 [Pholiota conissans]|uniref:DUF6533 domain-containing protein n=1 Tax=Pholiota conissans TaxID=109636 RepID=A0A9P5YTG2_9AGAR|nr:hypothetical protein BDN70DRAFT_840892 [Pholiota conissans]